MSGRLSLNSLRLGPTTLVVLALNALFIALAAYSLHHSHVNYEHRAQQLTQNLVTLVDQNLTANVEKIDLSLHNVVDELQRQLALGGIDQVSSSAFVARQGKHNPELEGLRVVDATGHSRIGSGPGKEKHSVLDLSARGWFQTQRDQASAGLVVSRPIRSMDTGEWIISFSRRLVTPDGQFAGAVSASAPVTHFSQIISTLDIGKNGVVLLRDADLGLVARVPSAPDPKLGEIGNTKVSAELRELFNSGAKQATFHTLRSPAGVERTSSFRRLSAGSFIVIVGLGAVDYMAGWWSELRTMLAFCLAFAAITIGATLMLHRSLAGRRSTQARLALLANVFQHNGEAIVIIDERNHIIDINQRFTELTGLDMDDVRHRDARQLAGARTPHEQLRELATAVNTHGHWQGELWLQHKAGHEIPTWLSMAAMRDADGTITHRIASFSETTVLKQAQEDVLHLAHHDTLTNLPNRASLQEHLSHNITTARREGRQLAVMFIDLDRFKDVNDTLGHVVGDGLLVAVAERLKAVVRDSDVVARLGGDEFVIVLSGLTGSAGEHAALVASKIVREFERPFQVQGNELHSAPSIGIGIYPDDGSDGETLMKNADAAMYHAKSAGRNNFQFFTAALNEAASERLAIEGGLRHALERGEFVLHYQPQVVMADGQVRCVEALVRWQHPERGLLPPMSFIPVAEDTGLIVPIGDWILGHALQQLARWRQQGLTDLRMAVNLSGHQLRVNGFLEHVAAHLRRASLPASALELEITESVAMQQPERTVALLQALRQLGVALAIDDFGTGYSSLSHLKQMPLNCLKLDRSFVRDIEHDANDAAISAATLSMAHSLGLTVVAEGVENPMQLEFLRRLGCDSVQGHHFSAPLPANECAAFVAFRNGQALCEEPVA